MQLLDRRLDADHSRSLLSVSIQTFNVVRAIENNNVNRRHYHPFYIASVMSFLRDDVMPGDAVLDCAADDVRQEEVAELVALYAGSCVPTCEAIAFLEVRWVVKSGGGGRSNWLMAECYAFFYAI